MAFTRRVVIRGGAGGLLLVAARTGRARAAEGPRAITIGTSSASVPGSTARIVKEMGLFEKHGIAATVTAMDTGGVATAGLLAGSFDFVSSGPSDVVVAQARGQNVLALISTYHGFAANVILSKAAAEKTGLAVTAPSAQRWKAMDGMTIASTSAQSTYTVGIKSAAEAAEAKLKVVYMAQPAMIAAFARGVVDGFTSSAPYMLPPVLSGTGVIWISGPAGDFPARCSPANSTVLMVRGDFARAHPELMKQVSDTFDDFRRAVVQRPDEVKAAMARLWPSLDAKAIDLVFSVDAPGFNAGTLTLEDMRHEIDFMKLGDFQLPNADKLDPAAMLVRREPA